jgi:hypothetical protein
MRRIILATAICGVTAAAVFVAGWKLVHQEPEAIITRAEAAAEAKLPTIWPFELMTTRGRNLPVEDVRDAF